MNEPKRFECGKCGAEMNAAEAVEHPVECVKMKPEDDVTKKIFALADSIYSCGNMDAIIDALQEAFRLGASLRKQKGEA